MAMLFILLKLTNIVAAIRFEHFTMTMLFTLEHLSYVFLALLCEVDSKALLCSVFPLAAENIALANFYTELIELALPKQALAKGSILRGEYTMTLSLMGIVDFSCVVLAFFHILLFDKSFSYIYLCSDHRSPFLEVLKSLIVIFQRFCYMILNL